MTRENGRNGNLKTQMSKLKDKNARRYYSSTEAEQNGEVQLKKVEVLHEVER